MNKKAAAGVAVSLLAASVATNAAFDPAELIHSSDYLARHTQMTQLAAVAGDDVLASYTEDGELSHADKVRAWFIRLPVALKASILLPLWGIGAVPVAIGTVLASALAPIWSQVLGVLLQAGVLVGLFCGVYKLLFPKRRVRDLFKKRNLKWLVVGAVAVAGGNMVLSQLWAGWPVLSAILMAAVGFGVVALLWKRLCGKFKAPEPEPVQTRLVLEY